MLGMTGVSSSFRRVHFAARSIRVHEDAANLLLACDKIGLARRSLAVRKPDYESLVISTRASALGVFHLLALDFAGALHVAVSFEQMIE